MYVYARENRSPRFPVEMISSGKNVFSSCVKILNLILSRDLALE